MKKSLVLLAAVLFITSSTSYSNISVSLSKAITNGWVQVDISGVDGIEGDEFVSHYGACITATIVNTSGKTLELIIENGRMLSSVDSAVQQMVITKTRHMVLSPGHQQSELLFAMCAEAFDSSPDSDSKFVLGQMAKEKVRKMSEEIEKRNAQNSTGQSAMWVVTDDKEITNIIGNDVSLVNILRQKASDITGKKMVRYVPSSATKKPLYTFRGSFDFSLPKPGKVTLALYTTDNTHVMDLMTNKTYPMGRHSYTYHASSDGFKPGYYYIKLFLNNEYLSKIKVSIGR